MWFEAEPPARAVPRVGRRRAVALGAVAVLVGCAHPEPPTTPSTVHGVVTFATVSLPAGAQLEVTLEDTARADAPSVRIAAWRTLDPQPGVRYTLEYDPARVPPHARLAVRARITDGTRLLHTSDRHHSVPRGERVTRVDLALRAIAR
jgi:putative lipoprotein